jgi:CheY-like chemotaxis protein
LDLINDILDLSKIEAGMLELHFELCSLADICLASLQLTKGMAQHKKQQIQYEPPTEPMMIRADARHLKQILVNLLSNAIKFSPEKSELGLDVEINKAGQNIKITIWDKGIGIKPENMHKLFKPFTQIDSSLAREYSGSGLGLSLVHRLAELHNGGVEVESIFGQGSRFTLTLPWSPPDEFSFPNLNHPDFVGGPNPTLLESFTSPYILMADDNEVVLEMFADYLEFKHYRVIKTRSGAELLERSTEIHPAVIIVDIQMPGMDGLETIRRIRSNTDPVVAITPVIAVTALAMRGDREKCMEAGADEYLSKPVKLADLGTAIQNLIEKKQ